MTAATPLDALCAIPFHDADAAARAAILRRLADTELHVALVAEPAGDNAELRRLPLPDGGEVALACDDEARLAAATGGPVPYAAMPGRVLARMLAEAGVALLVNPGAPSQMLLDPQALSWLTAALAPAPEDAGTAAAPLSAPEPAVVAALAPALGERLADMAGLAETLALVRAGEGHLILVGGAAGAAQPAVAKALAELLAFLPPLPSPVDVAFTDAAPPAGAVTLRLEALPTPPPAPKGPPRLR